MSFGFGLFSRPWVGQGAGIKNMRRNHAVEHLADTYKRGLALRRGCNLTEEAMIKKYEFDPNQSRITIFAPPGGVREAVGERLEAIGWDMGQGDPGGDWLDLDVKYETQGNRVLSIIEPYGLVATIKDVWDNEIAPYREPMAPEKTVTIKGKEVSESTAALALAEYFKQGGE